MFPMLPAYLLGVVTLPAMYGAFLLCVALFARDGFVSRECGACAWEQHDRIPIVRWERLKVHRIWGKFTPWHRQSLAIIRLEYGQDPLSGKRLGPEFRVTGEGVTVLTNLRIREA